MYKRILVPIDGSETAQRGLCEAVSLARAFGARLILLNVVDDLAWLAAGNSEELVHAIRRYGDEVLAKGKEFAAASDIKAETVLRGVVGKRAAESILEIATRKECDLIVMGTHGRKALGRLLLGSDAAAVVAESAVPVMLVRSAKAAG